MKRLFILMATGGILLAGSSCQKTFLDLKPEDALTEAAYFTKPEQFKAAGSDLYKTMISWQSIDKSNIYDFMDFGSDLSSNVVVNADYGRGSISTGDNDVYWDNPYKYIRQCNILLEKADAYSGAQADIQQYVGEAKFFRAWQYFFLLKRFGGVPIVTTVLDLNSPELEGSRNSRYEVVDQILSDLDDAIADLPTEQAIPSADKGRVSKWAAEAFEARVLLYEATWRKYVGTSTDFQGSGGPASDQVSDFLAKAITLSKDVMDNGGYELWNYNSVLANQSYYYLFSLEDGGSNPAGLDKTTNHEFILKSVYDYNLRRGGINLTHTVNAYMGPSRKMMDMYLCTDGLPVDKSPLFQGYHDISDEYQNRDYRLLGYVGLAPTNGSITLDGGAGYGNRKFAAYKYGSYRNANEESQDYPQIRLSEVYLIYAEALVEKNGTISDADLDASINKVRARAGVASLTNALATTYGLDMLTEIRRERAIEFYGENNRYDDLKRWGIAEQELNQPICGMVVGDASYPTEFVDASGNPTSKYLPNTYVYGETTVATGKGDLECVVIDGAANRNFQRKDYLFPLPLHQMQLNTNLVQNPGW